MPKLDPGGVAAVAKGAGFTGEALRIAVAVSFAENGSHDTEALGDTTLTDATWGPSVGLWQIRSLKAERGKGTPRDRDALLQAGFNAKAAYQISGGGKNWTPWTMYTNGRYRQHLAAADEAIKAAEDGEGVQRIRDLLGGNVQLPGSDIGSRLTEGIGAAIKNTYRLGVSFGYVLLAIVLLALGVAILMRVPTRKVGSAVLSLLPQGRGAKAAPKAPAPKAPAAGTGGGS